MKLPNEVIKLLNDEGAAKVLTSVSAEGIPHTIAVGSMMAPQEDLICAAEIMMNNSTKNLKLNPNVSILVIKGLESYQIKAEVKSYQTEGQLLDNIKIKLEKMNLPCHGIWLFKPLTVYNQSANSNAGTKMI